MRIRAIIFGVCILSFCFSAKAQSSTDSIRFENVKLSVDTLVTAGSFHLVIDFFLANASGVQKVFIKVGDLSGSDNLFSDVLIVKNHKEKFYYYLDNKNEIIRNWGGHSSLNYSINQSDVGKAKWVTIYTKKRNGEQSTPVSYQIH